MGALAEEMGLICTPIQTDLVGHAVEVRSPGSLSSVPLSLSGKHAVIRAVYVDLCGQLCYVLELEGGGLIETLSSNFRLVQEPGAGEQPTAPSKETC